MIYTGFFKFELDCADYRLQFHLRKSVFFFIFKEWAVGCLLVKWYATCHCYDVSITIKGWCFAFNDAKERSQQGVLCRLQRPCHGVLEGKGHIYLRHTRSLTAAPAF